MPADLTGLLLPLLCGVLVGLGLFVGVLAVVGVPERDPGKPPRFSRGVNARGTTTRLAAGIGAFLLVWWLTSWPVAGLWIGLLTAFWDRVAGDGRAERLGIAKLDGLASWTESLRDTIAGAVGLEQAIPATAVNASPSIRSSLNLLVDRLRTREPLPEALIAFAEDLDDPSADVTCSALVLNARLRGPGLRDVLSALASSTREELDMRRRIEASRKSIRRSVRIVLLIIVGIMGMLAVFNRQYVAPYGTFTGQLVLVVVGLVLGGGLLWLRRLSTPEKLSRFLVVNDSLRDRDGAVVHEASR